MVLWGRDGSLESGDGMDLGSAGFMTFHFQVAVTNSVKSKRTFIGMWLQAWLDPEAERISPGLSTSPSLHSAVLCAGF